MAYYISAPEPRFCRLGNTFLMFEYPDEADLGARRRTRSHPGFNAHDDVKCSTSRCARRYSSGGHADGTMAITEKVLKRRDKELEKPRKRSFDWADSTDDFDDRTSTTDSTAWNSEFSKQTTETLSECATNLAEFDGITTVMIRNLPGKVCTPMLVQRLDQAGFAGTYDFIHVPRNFASGLNKGYAFVNFLTPEDTVQVVRAWNLRYNFGSGSGSANYKPVVISSAELQGCEANVMSWSNAKLRHIKNPNYRPMYRRRNADGSFASSLIPLELVASKSESEPTFSSTNEPSTAASTPSSATASSTKEPACAQESRIASRKKKKKVAKATEPPVEKMPSQGQASASNQSSMIVLRLSETL